MTSYGIEALISSGRYHRIYLRGAGFPEPARTSRAERQQAQKNKQVVAQAAERKNQ